MNYIKEINAFYIEVETNPLSSGAVSLWHTLLHMNNRVRWAGEFSVAAAVLCYKSGLSLSSFKRARTELKEKGFITFTSRGSKAPLYQMISLVQEVDQSVSQPSDQKEGDVKGVDVQVNHEVSDQVNQEVTQEVSQVMSPLYKQNEIKQKETKKSPSTFIKGDLYLFYVGNFGKPSAYIKKELMTWSEIVGEGLVYEALKRGLENGKATWNYVKGILNRWQKDQLVTVNDVLVAEERYRANRSLRSKKNELYSSTSFGNRDEHRGEVVPAWFREMKERERMEQERVVR